MNAIMPYLVYCSLLLCVEIAGSKLTPQQHITGSDEKSQGYFLLRDLTNGSGVFYISRNGAGIQYSTIHEETSSDGQPSTDVVVRESDIPLICGVSFVAGHLEFCLAALPMEQLFTVRMFSAARSGNLSKLKTITEFAEVAQGDLDFNVEYSSPYYADDSDFDRLHRFRRTSTQVTQLSIPSSPIYTADVSTAESQPQRLLLHIAIVNKDTEMVKFLLEKGADVSSNDVHVCSNTHRFQGLVARLGN